MRCLKQIAMFFGVRALIPIGLSMLAVPAQVHAEDLTESLRNLPAVTITVSDTYRATSRFDGVALHDDIPYVDQPFAAIARRLFEIAGVRAADDAPLRLSIEAQGTTDAALYDTSIDGVRVREAMYRSAILSGTIRLQLGPGTVERTFEGSIGSPYDFMMTFGYDPYRDPSNAPFREAFEAPGGYLEAIATLVGDVYGASVLETALKDRDPLVRRAAELALGRAGISTGE